MIYLKNSIGIELRGEDMVVTCLSSNFSGEVFTHFKRVAGYRARERAEVRAELEQFFRTRRLGRDNIVLGLPRRQHADRREQMFRDLAERLRQKTCKEVVLWDESLSTAEAFDRVRQTGRNRRDAQREIDMHAAAVILQSYLDELARHRRPS